MPPGFSQHICTVQDLTALLVGCSQAMVGGRAICDNGTNRLALCPLAVAAGLCNRPTLRSGLETGARVVGSESICRPAS
jgi:hypothetical protein